jgi:23S rRNA (guanosine2251-2'-O)-methyltransferase
MIIYGKQIINYILEFDKTQIEKLYLSKEIDKKEFAKFRRLNIDIIRVDNKKAQAMSRNGNHQGYIAQIRDIKPKTFKEIKELKNILILAKLTDVGNIGGIFRSAYSLGIDGIIITGLKNPNLASILRVSSGALLNMPFCLEDNVLDIINELKQRDFDIYSADMSGENIHNISIDSSRSRALVLGSEGEGVPSRVLKFSTKIVSIPMQNSFNSLNVSVAAGILIDRMRG